MRSCSPKQKPVRGPTIIFDVVAPQAILVSLSENYSIIKLSFAVREHLAGTHFSPYWDYPLLGLLNLVDCVATSFHSPFCLRSTARKRTVICCVFPCSSRQLASMRPDTTALSPNKVTDITSPFISA
jgi:hypothetical protein